MTLARLFQTVLDALEAAGIPYMLTGSLASTHYGVPRATEDIDVVIDPDEVSLERLLTSVAAKALYVSPPTARTALANRDQFNVIDAAAGVKVDLVIVKERTFSREEFARRRLVEVLGRAAFVVSPEDSILSKLEWAAQSGSERQLRDVAGVIEVVGATLDIDYMRLWAKELGVLATLELLLRDHS